MLTREIGNLSKKGIIKILWVKTRYPYKKKASHKLPGKIKSKKKSQWHQFRHRQIKEDLHFPPGPIWNRSQKLKQLAPSCSETFLLLDQAGWSWKRLFPNLKLTEMSRGCWHPASLQQHVHNSKLWPKSHNPGTYRRAQPLSITSRPKLAEKLNKKRRSFHMTRDSKQFRPIRVKEVISENSSKRTAFSRML